MLRAQKVITNTVGEAAECLAGRLGTLITDLGEVLIAGGDPSGAVIGQVQDCVMEAISPCGCGGGGGKKSSFPVGTEVQTPDGPVRIEDIREGDLVLARAGFPPAPPLTAPTARHPRS